MAEYRHGEMDAAYQQRLFSGFVKFTIRSCVLIAVILVLMAAFLL